MSRMTASQYIKQLGLEEHPEGGFYRRIYQSDDLYSFQGFSDPRHNMTAIQYLLDGENFSSWHRIKSDELWLLSDSNTDLLIHELVDDGLVTSRLCAFNPTVLVKAGRWFAAELADKNRDNFALCHCVVSPGFDFADFELASAANLSKLCPTDLAKAERLLIAV
jgi:predicted cupin superfamily sugar epimerase